MNIKTTLYRLSRLFLLVLLFSEARMIKAYAEDGCELMRANRYEVTAYANPTEGGTVSFDNEGDMEELVFDFDDGTAQGWTVLQGLTSTSPHNWMHSSEYTDDELTGLGHNDSYGFMVSESYIGSTTEGVYPDNYLVSPRVKLGGSIHFWATNFDADYGAEHFAVSVSTESNTVVSDFIQVQEWTFQSTGVKHGNTRDIISGVWYEYTIDLSAYSGTGYVAIHHFNCYEQWLLCVDDITIVEGEDGISKIFNEGESCTLTATANDDYTFVNWIDNGEVVSTDVSYTFTVSTDITLMANFVLNGTVANYWTPVNAGLYSGSTTIIAVVKINGVEQNSDQIELAVFSGVKCRGTAFTMEFPVTHRYLALVNVYGENGDELSFKAYDHSTNQEMEINPVVTVVFSEDGYGTLLSPLELNFAGNAVSQTISLLSGTNWVSFNVETTMDDLRAALVAALPETEIIIKSQTQSCTYKNNRWTGSLKELDDAKMYLIKTTVAAHIMLSGRRIDPAEQSVTIVNGINWIAYPFDTDMSVTNAFAGFAVDNDMIKAQTTSATYKSNRWTGQLKTLEPGCGYIYKSAATNNRVFTFPTDKKGEESR